MRWWALLLLGCAKPQPVSAVDAVSVAPQSTGSPTNEPTLLLGTPKPIEPGDVERVKVKDEQPDANWKPPKDRCPDGVTEMMAVHVALGDSIELAPGATPVAATSGTPDAADVIYDRTRKIVRITARKYGLVFVLTEQGRRCTWYGVNAGY